MKLIIFGATGMMGKELVKQALFDGHEVWAFGRNVFTEALPENDHLHLIQGALFDEGEVYKAIKDKDAVLSVLGGAMNGTDKTRSLGMKNIVKQMQKAAVKRIVAVGGIGVLDDAEGKMLMDDENFPPEYYPVSLEHRKAFECLRASNLNWTFVCPPNIVPGDPTGEFISSANTAPEPNKYRISSGDLALFMLKEIAANQYPQTKVGISN